MTIEHDLMRQWRNKIFHACSKVIPYWENFGCFTFVNINKNETFEDVLNGIVVIIYEDGYVMRLGIQSFYLMKAFSQANSIQNVTIQLF